MVRIYSLSVVLHRRFPHSSLHYVLLPSKFVLKLFLPTLLLMSVVTNTGMAKDERECSCGGCTIAMGGFCVMGLD